MNGSKSKNCKFFLNTGACRDGNKCTFTHVARKNEPCRYAAAGKCTAGERCVFQHAAASVSSAPRADRPSAPVQFVRAAVDDVVSGSVRSGGEVPPQSMLANHPPGMVAREPLKRTGVDYRAKPWTMIDYATTALSDEGRASAEAAIASTLPSAKATLRTVFGSRKASVPRTETKVLEYCQKMGYAVVESDDRNVDHPLSHTCRELATLYVAQQEIPNLTRARIASVYGVQRDKTLLEVKDRGHSTLLTATVDLIPNRFFPGDCTRHIERVEPKGEYDLVFAVDVYWHADKPVTPNVLAEWCKLSRTNSMYVVTRMYRGAAGSDSVDLYTGPEEGVWYRDDQDMIVFSPDAGNFTYPRHFDINFLEYKTIDRLDIRHQATIGPYYVFKIHLSSSVTTVPVAVHLTPNDPLIDWMILQTPTLWGKIGCFQCQFDENNAWYYNWFVRERRFLHNTQIMNSHWLANVVRQPTGYVFDGVASKVQEAAKDDKTMCALRIRFPKVFTKIVKGTAMAILYKHRRAMANDMRAVREDHADTEMALIDARSVSPLQQTRSWCQRILVLLCLVWMISLLIASQYSRTVAKHDKRSIATQSSSSSEILLGVLSLVCICVGGCVWASIRLKENRRAVYEQWRDARIQEPGSERSIPGSMWVRLTEEDVLPPVEVEAMPTHEPRGTLKITVDGMQMTPKQAFDALRGTRPGRNMLYPLIMAAPMYAPAKTECNLLFAAYARIHAEPASTANDETLNRNWRLVQYLYEQIIPEGVLKPHTMAECASAWAKTKAEIFLHKANDLQEGRHRDIKAAGTWWFSRKELNVKTNETIGRKMPYVIKPRSIVVMDVFDHVLNSPWARATADAMHEMFSGQWYSYSVGSGAHAIRMSVRLWFGSGLTGAQLGEIGRAIGNGDNVIAVAGDDIIMRIGSKILEGDLSACDQSHTLPCIVACGNIDVRMGTPREVVEHFTQTCIQPYVASYQRIVLRGNPGPQLPTGSARTTVRNTQAVMGLCLAISIRMDENPQDVANDLGFKLKVQIHEHIEYATFLKGLFLPDSRGALCWFNLPSMVVKIGKLQTPPKKLGGVAKASRAMAQGMVGIPHDYPILGAAIRALYRNGAATTSVLNAAEDGWYKPTVSSCGIDRATALDVICRRYDITIQEINRVENLYDSVTSVPAFLMDPVFNKLVERDYE